VRTQVNLSQSTLQSLKNSVEALRTAIDSQQAVLFNAMGQQLVKCGDSDELDLDLVVPLVANGIAAIKEASHFIEEEEGFTLYYHTGSNSDIYGASIHRDLMILLRLNQRNSQTRIGTVWYYLQQAIKEMRSLFQPSHPEAPIEKSVDRSMQSQDTVPSRLLPYPSEEHPPTKGEGPADSSAGKDAPEKKHSNLLSYEDAKTEGLIRSER
jgi:hypothetical protein